MHMKTDDQTAAITKQEYQTPHLSEHGSLTDVTLADASSGSDGGAMSAN